MLQPHSQAFEHLGTRLITTPLFSGASLLSQVHSCQLSTILSATVAAKSFPFHKSGSHLRFTSYYRAFVSSWISLNMHLPMHNWHFEVIYACLDEIMGRGTGSIICIYTCKWTFLSLNTENETSCHKAFSFKHKWQIFCYGEWSKYSVKPPFDLQKILHAPFNCTF